MKLMLRAVGRSLPLVVLWLACLVAPAHALVKPDPGYWKSSAPNRDVVYRYMYTKSPQSIPSSYDPVTEAERITSQAAKQASQSAAKDAVAAETRAVVSRAALMPAVRALGVIGLAVGTFEVGWKIGTGINAKFLRIGLPPPPEPKTHAAAGTLVFQDTGWISTFNDEPLPEPGWVLQYPAYQQQWTAVNINRGWEDPCAFLAGPPSGFQALVGHSQIGWCDENPLTVTYWLPEEALKAYFVEDYTDQTYDVATAAPAPPVQATVEATIDAQLDDPSNQTLRDFLNYQLGSPLATDPLGMGPTNPQYDFPERGDKLTKHKQDEDLPLPSTWTVDEYWRRASEIVERGEDGLSPNVIRCHRLRDDTIIYYDKDTQEMVIVKGGEVENGEVDVDKGGYIETMYKTTWSGFKNTCENYEE